MPNPSEDSFDPTPSTLANYSGRSEAFWQGTRDHDVTQNIQALLQAILGDSPYAILDIGCGPGRDLAAFKALGHAPIGLDGCAEFCEMAASYSGAEVWHQNFLKLKLPASHFHGIFANASLFHVPKAELPGVLSALHGSLKPGGVLFSSNPKGQDEEGWNGDRYGCYHSLAGWTRFLTQAGFTAVDHYYRPTGLPPSEQSWLASVWRRG
jgi:SAM-dependent methyltransferase